jgi:hypothetical protein
VQVHDFNPGFGKEVSPVGSNGFGTRTFWTVAIPEDDVEVHLGAGRAEMEVENLHLGDYGNLANATGANFQTAFDPAVVSFDVVWDRPITRRVSVPDGTLGNHYAGEYVEDQVTVTWSGKNLATGFSFTSNPGTFATSSFDGGFAELGHERNGAFFGEGGDDDAASLARALGTRAPQGEEAALDRFFAALPLGGTGLAPRLGDGGGPTLVTSRPESGFAGDRAPTAAAVPTERPPGPDLFAAVGRPVDDVLVR